MTAVTCSPGIVYSPGLDLKGDVYARSNASNDPLALYWHGGAFEESKGSRFDRPDVNFCRELAGRGVVVVSCDYETGAAFPAPLKNVVAAAAFFSAPAQLARFNAKPGRTALVGTSAGGLMILAAASALHAEMSLSAVVPISGTLATPFISKLASRDRARIVAILCAGHDPSTVAGSRALHDYLPEFNQGFLPPVLLVHGDEDKRISIKNAIWLDEKMTERRVRHATAFAPGLGHGVKPGLAAVDKIAAFIIAGAER